MNCMHLTSGLTSCVRTAAILSCFTTSSTSGESLWGKFMAR